MLANASNRLPTVNGWKKGAVTAKTQSNEQATSTSANSPSGAVGSSIGSGIPLPSPQQLQLWRPAAGSLEPSVLVEDETLIGRGAEAFCGSDAEASEVDAVISLGGTRLFPKSVLAYRIVPSPPVIAFALGTVGFLTPFPPRDFAGVLERVLTTGCAAQSRPRLALRVEEGGP